MSYPFELPYPESIRVESRLRPEQVDVSYPDVLALEEDIRSRLPGAADVVMMKLRKCAAPYSWPLAEEMIAAALQGEVSSDIEEALREQLSLATQATSKRVAAGLWFSAAKTRESYKATAIQLMEESNALLDLICAAVQLAKNPSLANTSQPAPRPQSRIVKMAPRI